MHERRDQQCARIQGPAGKTVLNAMLLALLLAIAAVQAAHAHAGVPGEPRAPGIVRTSEPQTGLSSGSLRLAIHINREKVEGQGDSKSGSSADEEGDGDTKTADEDGEKSDDERASGSS